MKRPFLLRISPLGLKTPLYYRLYHRQRNRWAGLYTDAPLHFSPQMRMTLLATDEGHSNIAFTGFYELDLSRKIFPLAVSGGIMIDVGANYGYFSLLWAGANPRNRVFAFEASPKNGPALLRNVEKNGLAGRVDVQGVAVGREPGVLRFAPGPKEETGWGGFTLDRDEGAIEVRVRTLDDLLPPGIVVKVLKIDVEGADTWVLQGAEQLLRQRRVEHIFFEQNKPRMRSLGIRDEEAAEHLGRFGYAVFPFSDPSGGLVEYHARPG